MDQRIYHGDIQPIDIAKPLMAHFSRGSLRVQQVGSGAQVTIQIATTGNPSSGGQTALSVIFQKVEDGVAVRVGQQAWMGIAASLGLSALSALRNPFALLGRLDDIAQDIENLQMTDEVWRVLDAVAKTLGTGHELSERLRRLECHYCSTANEINAASCIACGAPLGGAQPKTCKQCGFVSKAGEKHCQNCGKLLP